MDYKIDRRGFLKGTTSVVAAGAVTWPLAAYAGTTLDFSEVLPEENWQTVAIKAFAEDLAEASGGEVTLNIHSGGALGFKGPEHLRVVESGVVPMADVLLAQAAGDEPIFKLENLPFLVESPEDLKTLHQYLWPEIEKIAAKHNQKFLTTMPSPQNCIYMKIKTDNLDDFHNVKVRGADKTSVETFNAIGMAGVQIPWGELIPALATGRVDGVGTSPTSAVDGKFWEFLQYVYVTNHIWATNVISINLDAWNGLSKEAQDAMLATAEKHEPLFWAASKKLGDEALARLEAEGMEIVPVSPSMFAEMQKRTSSSIDTYVEQVPEVKPILEQYLEAVGRS